jgi:hypothetical protein
LPDKFFGLRPFTFCQDDRPYVFSFSSTYHSTPFTTFYTDSFYARCCGSRLLTHDVLLRRGTMSHLPDRMAHDRQPNLVLQDHGIDTVSALYAAEGLDLVFTGILQVVVPLGHEQASTTSAASRRELPDCGKRL